MKKIICLLSFICCNLLSFAQTEGNYIDFLDGKRLELGKEEIEQKVPMLGSQSLKVGNAKYPAKLIKGFQSDGRYYVQKNETFAYRLIHGKINGYQQTEYSPRGVSYNIFYLQKGEDADWIIYSKKAFLKLISDNPEALKMAEEHKKDLIFSKNVIDILKLYNQ